MKIIFGAGVLVLGIFIGKVLARMTEEELSYGRPWYVLVTFSSLFIGLIGLFTKNDFIMFGFFFIAIVASQSIRESKK
jgi:hypothetical membrane protein